MSSKGIEKRKLADLPPSEDEVWEGGQIERHKPVEIPICGTHNKDNWTKHIGYIDNLDGTISCKYCPWGARLPGYMRVYQERIVDLRHLAKD